jgi:hypothetical protein
MRHFFIKHNSVDLEASSRAGSADNSRRNKRKNFRPRNIVYSNNDDSETDDNHHPTSAAAVGTAAARADNTAGNNSPMDLSVPATNTAAEDGGSNARMDDHSDGSDSEGGAPTMAADRQQQSRGGLSVVRPEILFGSQREATAAIMERRRRQEQEEEEDDIEAPAHSTPTTAAAGERPSPLSLLSTFAGMSGVLSPFFKSDDTTGHSMREAFREVLKLYGMSSEMADSIMQNSAASETAKTPGRVTGTGSIKNTTSLFRPLSLPLFSDIYILYDSFTPLKPT